MGGNLPPCNKRGRPTNSPDPKQQLLSKEVDIFAVRNACHLAKS